MADSFEPMDISDDDSLDSSNLKDVTYKVLSIDEIAHKMDQVIEDVVSSTKMPASIVRIALSQYDWDKWNMLEKFYDDQDKFFEKINVSNPFQEVATSSTADTTAKTVECLTCYEELPLNAIVSLSCNHMFCKDCWSQYLTVKINEGAELISCQNLKCNIFVDDPTVAQLLTDDKIKERYKQWITNSFVLSDPFLEWCPGADCTNAIEASSSPIHRLNCTCDCGHEFCFECRAAHHEPIPCFLFKKWHYQSEDLTLKYMMKNTKACPKCECLIEKNMGCDYMFCIRCRTEFCWVCFKKCFADWRYGHGMCNTPKDQRPSIDQNVVRYQRYNAKYEHQMRLLQSDKINIKSQIDAAIARSTRGGLLSLEITFLQNSFEVILACRKSLMASYVFAYSVVEGNQKSIFEENQNDLEISVNTLSNYLQIEETYENFADVNIKIKDKTEYCDNRRTKLRDHIMEGLDKKFWEFYKD